MLAKRSRPSGYIVDAIPALSASRGTRWRLAASPPVSRLGLAWRRRGACADRCAECWRLSPKQARCFDRPAHMRWKRWIYIERGGTSRFRRRGVPLGGLLFLSWRSSTCRKRVTGVEEAFVGRAIASYVCFDYRMRPSRRADCQRGLHPDVESDLRLPGGSAARHELAPGPDWPWGRARGRLAYDGCTWSG